MDMITPPENQGQIVETSYGWHDGALYRRIYDHSDRTEEWAVADEAEAARIPESWHPVNSVPVVRTWRPCRRPDR